MLPRPGQPFHLHIYRHPRSSLVVDRWWCCVGQVAGGVQWHGKVCSSEKWAWCGQWHGKVGDGVTKWAAAWENGQRRGKVGGGSMRGSSVEGWWCHGSGVAK